MKEKISIKFKDLYCLARLLKSAMAKDGNPFHGCQYCRFICHKDEELAPNYDHLIYRLRDITGVAFGIGPDMKDLKREIRPCGDSEL